MSNTSETQNTNNQPAWQKPALIIAGVIILVLLVWGIVSAMHKEEPVAAPPTEAPTAQPAAPAILISSPTNGQLLDITRPVKVEGQGQGLHEGNVVVQAQDEAGNILAQSTAVLQGKDVGVGGQGDWSVELNLEDVIPGTKGAIVAFSTKPASDGSSQRVAETRVDVLYGEKVEAMIVIREPSHGMVLDIDQPVEVKGQGQGLPEANVVVQALDASGNVLAQEATTLQGKKVGVGGKGDWAVALDLSQVTPGVRGRIVAFGTDPNGGRVAETGIDVTFGEAVEPTPEPTEEPVDPSEALEGRKWEMVNPLPDTEITLMFVRGKVTGFAGCNDFTGSYQTSSSGSIKIGDLKTGRRACEQPIMDQEKQFLASLGQATAFQVVEDQMTLNTPNGLLQFQTEDD